MVIDQSQLDAIIKLLTEIKYLLAFIFVILLLSSVVVLIKKCIFDTFYGYFN